MQRVLATFIALAVVMTPILARAERPQRGPYTSLFIGVSIPQSQNVNSYDTYTLNSWSDRVELDPGIAVGGTGGFDFGYVRLEGELAYRYSEIKNITEKGTNFKFIDVDGTLDALSFMFNVFVDIHNRSRVTPYLGGGIGFASLHLSDTFATDPRATPPRGPLYYDGYDTVFAYQAGAGLEISLNRQLSLDLGYRYFGTDTARINDNSALVTNMKLQSHNATVGVRFKF